jgi:hypothetical protein
MPTQGNVLAAGAPELNETIGRPGQRAFVWWNGQHIEIDGEDFHAHARELRDWREVRPLFRRLLNDVGKNVVPRWRRDSRCASFALMRVCAVAP